MTKIDNTLWCLAICNVAVFLHGLIIGPVSGTNSYIIATFLALIAGGLTDYTNYMPTRKEELKREKELEDRLTKAFLARAESDRMQAEVAYSKIKKQ